MHSTSAFHTIEGMQLAAHTPTEANPEWHLLLGHLQEVSRLAAQFGAKFGAEEICRLLGLSHDLGKAQPCFQEYLLACHQGKRYRGCPHSLPGAAAAAPFLNRYAMAVIGHHSQLPKRLEAEVAVENEQDKPAPEVAALAAELGLYALDFAKESTRSALDLETRIRMCFSALVDADYLDTERHMSPALAALRSQRASLADLKDALSRHLQQFRKADTPVGRVRAEVLDSCLSAATLPRGFFRLTVPTGGGKTLSSLAFALGHAAHHGLHRVICAIPFTSIIDQTAQVYSKAIGEANVLEHHSAFDVTLNASEQNDQSSAELRRRLAAENWDAPVIATTTVQLFESLFASRPSKCRKLHNIAQSVIVLDEVQTLPVGLLHPILHMLGQLVDKYGCSVVLCTATQPDYSPLKAKHSEPELALAASAREIVPNYADHFSALKRVAFERIEQPLSKADLIARLRDESKVLCILNTKADSAAIATELAKTSEDVFHLSTSMCGAHRRAVLAEVRARLKQGESVHLISTQLIEAGVDVDFPVVYRALAPLDSIIQAAGRCNREGSQALGKCFLFVLEGGGEPPAYQEPRQHTKAVLNDGLEVDSPEAMQSFFRDWLALAHTDDRQIQSLRHQLDYPAVSKRFRMIEDVPEETLLCMEYSPGEIQALLDEWGRIPGREWFAKAGRFTVSVRGRSPKLLQGMDLHESGLWLFQGPYSPLTGVQSAE